MTGVTLHKELYPQRGRGQRAPRAARGTAETVPKTLNAKTLNAKTLTLDPKPINQGSSQLLHRNVQRC